MTFTASDVLLKAASRIEEEGMWCQGVFYQGYTGAPSEIGLWLHRQGKRVAECARAAIWSAALELGEPSLAYKAGAHLALHLSASLPAWNDRPGRTADEVAEAMRQAAL